MNAFAIFFKFEDQPPPFTDVIQNFTIFQKASLTIIDFGVAASNHLSCIIKKEKRQV